jgi:putative oxidoreductase
MSIFEPASPRWTGRMLSILRIVAGLAFFTGGTMKVFGFPPFPQYAPPLPMPPMWEFHMAGWLETYLGAAFTLGLFTRPISFILAGEMAVAYFQFSYPLSFWPTRNWGITAMLYCFLFLYFMLAGAGPWSIDALIARRRERVG